MSAYWQTRLGVVVTIASDAKTDHGGYVATASVLTGRHYGRLRHSTLRPATAEDIQRAEAECLELANSPKPRHADSEMARARLAARKRLGRVP